MEGPSGKRRGRICKAEPRVYWVTPPPDRAVSVGLEHSAGGRGALPPLAVPERNRAACSPAIKIRQAAIRGTHRRTVLRTALLLEIRMRTQTDHLQTGLRRRIRFQVLIWADKHLEAGRFSASPAGAKRKAFTSSTRRTI